MAAQLAGDGYTDGEIAAELNERFQTSRTLQSVYHWRRRALVVSERPMGAPADATLRAAVLELLAAGLSLNAIAKRRGVREQCVRKMVRRLVADGLVKRTGGATRSARYVPTVRWTRQPVEKELGDLPNAMKRRFSLSSP